MDEALCEEAQFGVGVGDVGRHKFDGVLDVGQLCVEVVVREGG